MPGIPLSNRFQQCKKRKVKCDEAWPQCGHCKKLGDMCSGPPQEPKFVLNNCHAPHGKNKLTAGLVAAAHDTSRKPPPQKGKLVDVDSQASSDGSGTFHRMKIMAPSRMTRPENRLAAKLALYVECANGTGYNICMSEQGLAMIARRTTDSLALRDSLECLLASWENLRRGCSFKELLDLKLYGKALKSLRKAMLDPEQQESPLTLAAVSLVQKLEVTYDSNRGINRQSHIDGICGIMSCQDPSQLDETQLQLAFENMGEILSLQVVKRQDCVYDSPQWDHVLREAITGGFISHPRMIEHFQIALVICKWARLAKSLHEIYSAPMALSASVLALDLVSRTDDVLSQLDFLEGSMVASWFSTGAITLVPNAGALLGQRYEFTEKLLSELLADHAMACILFNRIRSDALAFLGLAADQVQTEMRNREWAERIWAIYPFAKELKPLGSTKLVMPLVVSYKSAVEPLETAMIEEALSNLVSYRDPPKGMYNRQSILVTAMAARGRLPFIRTQDAAVEARGQGARS